MSWNEFTCSEWELVLLSFLADVMRISLMDFIVTVVSSRSPHKRNTAHLALTVFTLKVSTGRILCLTRRWSKRLPLAQKTAEKMAALRVVGLSGSGRALLSTPKTIKTPTVGRYMNIVLITQDKLCLQQEFNKKALFWDALTLS